jgi:hypothetical protein
VSRWWGGIMRGRGGCPEGLGENLRLSA